MIESSPGIRNPRSGIQNLGFLYMGPASQQSTRFFLAKARPGSRHNEIKQLKNHQVTYVWPRIA